MNDDRQTEASGSAEGGNHEQPAQESQVLAPGGHVHDAGRTFTFTRTFSFGSRPAATENGHPVRGRAWRWEWKGPGQTPPASDRASEEVREPATYYEAITGRRDPQRDFFIRTRKIINASVWVIALGLPAGALALTILTGQDLQTIVLATFAAFIVGMMFRSSFPRTPFG